MQLQSRSIAELREGQQDPDCCVFVHHFPVSSQSDLFRDCVRSSCGYHNVYKPFSLVAGGLLDSAAGGDILSLPGATLHLQPFIFYPSSSTLHLIQHLSLLDILDRVMAMRADGDCWMCTTCSVSKDFSFTACVLGQWSVFRLAGKPTA